MRYYLGLDDTDTLGAPYGTGKIARWFESALPNGCRLLGVVRQQLLVHEDVPYTSHNSSACLIIEAENGKFGSQLIDAAMVHLREYALKGSDPGLCFVEETQNSLSLLIEYGRQCTQQVVSRSKALSLAKRAGIHLSAHGGTGDGIIGAMAAVGLTIWGWSGRYIEFGDLRSLPDVLTVSMLQENGIMVTSIDRDALLPAENDVVYTHGWCRPRLLGGKPVLLVRNQSQGVWYSLGRKRCKGTDSSSEQESMSCEACL
ncbi:MAG: hypothetical protein ACLFSF_06405 [Desulfonatronovibrio sp.]